MYPFSDFLKTRTPIALFATSKLLIFVENSAMDVLIFMKCNCVLYYYQHHHEHTLYNNDALVLSAY